MKNFNFDQIVNGLVAIYKDEAKRAEYEEATINTRYIMFGGWCGTMSPVNRAAFWHVFGQDVTTRAEDAARDIIQHEAAQFAASNYAAHAAEADAHEAAGQPVPDCGSFVWALNTGLKCEGGLPHAVNNLYWNDQQKENHTHRELVKVCAVYSCTAEQVNCRKFAEELVFNNMPFAGGVVSDDTEVCDFNAMTDTEKKTFYTNVAAVVASDGRWFLIDSEGYDYARYILLPLSARDMFADIYDDVRKREEKRKAEEAAREDRERAERRAAYEAKCAKWLPLMRNVRELMKESGGECSSTVQAARRHNIRAMVAKVFPGLDIKVSRTYKGYSYMGYYTLSWTDGPTVEEMREKCDLDIFEGYIEKCDMSDYWSTEAKEFKKFADEYFAGVGSIRLKREISKEVKKEIEKELAAILAPLANDKSVVRSITSEERTTIINKLFDLDLMPGGGYRRAIYNSWSIFEIIRLIVESKSYYVAPAEKITHITKEKDTIYVSDTNGEDVAPHESLTLCDDGRGCIYVEGSTRATYYNRKAIKAHGCTWNKAAGRWEATTPEDVATLRAWFALRCAM